MSAPLAAAVVQPVPIPIHAPSVVTSTTDVQNALPDIFPIITRLKVDAWEHAFKDAGICEKYNDILVGLREGFTRGLENISLSWTFIPRNHYISSEDEELIFTKYAQEIELGRILHGYDPEHLF